MSGVEKHHALEGTLVFSQGKVFQIFQVLDNGLDGPRVSGNPIYKGRVLMNTTKYLGLDWRLLIERHLDRRSMFQAVMWRLDDPRDRTTAALYSKKDRRVNTEDRRSA